MQTVRRHNLIFILSILLFGSAFLPGFTRAADCSRATFDTAADFCGSGPASTGSPCTVETGTLTLTNTGVTESSLFVDPAAGLAGSAKGLHLIDVGPWVSPGFHTASPNVCTDGTTYWIDFSFRIDPDNSASSDGLIEIFAYDDGGNQILRIWLGRYDVSGNFRYKFFFNGGSVNREELAPLSASDEWRVLVRVDAAADTQTHWVWKNGQTLQNQILGTPYSLVSPQTTEFDVMTFRTALGGALTDFVLDEFSVANDGPPLPPSDLLAVPQADGSVQLSWTDGSIGEDGFKLERSLTGDGGWSEVADLTAEVTSHNDATGLSSGTRYYYRVAAYSSGGNSPWSNSTWTTTIFTGYPMSDWIDITDHAICGGGGGSCDWSATLQSIIDTLIPYSPVGTVGNSGQHVIYFPDGLYELGSTVFMEGRTGVQFVGESRGGVVLKWTGPSGTDPYNPAVMFHSDGNKRSAYRNLIWDGGAAPGSLTRNYVVAFDQSYCGNPTSGVYNTQCDLLPWADAGSPERGLNDTGSVHIDSEYRNAWIGMRIGHFNVQVDEQTIRRCRFDNNFAGVSIEDANALSLFFWDSEWSGNRYGVTNSLGQRRQREDSACGNLQCSTDTDNWAGDYRVLRGRFLQNYVDAWVAPTGHFTFRDCWSKGSGQFVYGHGLTTTPGRISLVGCQVDELAPCTDNESIVCYPSVCDPLPDPFLETFDCTVHEGRAVENLNSGALVLLDNRFDSTYTCGESTCDHGPPIYGHTWVTSDIFAVGNGYTVDPSIDPLAPYIPGNNKIRTLDDYLLGPFDLVVPPIPTAIDELSTRPVYTVTDVANLQAVIDAAEADPLPAVVHIPSGRYFIDEPLQIDAGSDLILAGNGTSTELRWLSGTEGTMLEIDGRNAAGVTVRDLNMRGIDSPNDRGDATCIHVSHVNQDGAAVLLNKISARSSAPGSEDAGIVIDECDRVQVDIVDLQSAGNRDNIGVLVKAGPQPDQVPKAVWTGTVLGNEWDFDIVNNVNGVRFMVSSTYMEDSVHYLRARGDAGPGDVVVHSGKMAIQNPFVTPPLFDDAVTIDDFSGNVSVIGCRLVDQEGDTPAIVRQTGDAGVNVQLIGNAVYENPAYAVEPSAYVIRTNEKYWCLDVPDDHPECYDGNNQLLTGWRPVPDQGQYPEDNDLLLDGLDLLRTLPMPGFYNDSSATTAYNVVFDSVIVGQCASGIVLSGDLPAAPTGLVAAPIDSSQIDLAWVDPEGNEEGFRVERSPSPGGGFVEIGTTGPDDTFFNDTGLDPGTRYYYRVAANNGITGDSGFAGPADAATLLLEPTALQVTGFDCGSVSLQWSDGNVGEDGFRVERSENPVGGFALVGNAPADASAFVDDTTDDGRVYFYQVVAFNADADSAPSNIVNSATTSCDDGVDCTADSCDATGQCVNTDSCPGGQACFESRDQCVLECFNDATCDDGLDCTQDRCLFELGLPGTPGKCRNQQLCSDGNACTVNDCDPGSDTCVSSPRDCDDADQCTIDDCDGDDGCSYSPVDCFDADICTIDSCDPVTGCINPPINCSDGIECTTDLCDPVTGCAHVDNCPGGQVCSESLGRCTTECFDDNECDDGLACTLDRCLFELGLPGTPGFCRNNDTCMGGDTCSPEVCGTGGVCIPQPLDCDDTDPCTLDVCDPGSGCEHVGTCPPPAGPAGQVGEQLFLAKEAGGTIRLSWPGSCLATDEDYALFEGEVSDSGSHVPIYCSTQGETFKSFSPSAGSRYYLVAPVSSDREGSYGTDSDGLERNPGPASCLTQEIDMCG